MGVQLAINELRDALRISRIRSNSDEMINEAQVDEAIDDLKDFREELRLHPPEKRIRRNPVLALDNPCMMTSSDAVVTELLRWFHNPELARGMSHFIPRGHPCGFGGLTIYVPKDFPLPEIGGRHGKAHP